MSKPNNKLFQKNVSAMSGKDILRASIHKKAATSGIVDQKDPENNTERTLQVFYDELLGTIAISTAFSFFHAGGNSLKATQLISRIRKAFNIELKLNDVFENATISELAILIGSVSKSKIQKITPIETAADYPVSATQYRMWLLSRFGEGSSAYHMIGRYNFDGNFKRESFENAIQHLISRHENLRTSFLEREGEIRQQILNSDAISFKPLLVDFSNDPEPEVKKEAFIREEFNKPFNLNEAPLFRCYFLVNNGETEFFFVIHHIICDGWSMDILLRDVMTFYEAECSGKQAVLPELNIQYKDYTAWQNERLSGNGFEQHSVYWKDRLNGSLPILELPGAFVRPPVKTTNGSGISTYLSSQAFSNFRNVCQENGSTIFHGLLSLWKVLFFRYTSQSDLVIGTPVAGRLLEELENQIGAYVNTVVLRNNVTADKSFNDLLKEITINTNRAFEFQDYPFDKLVEDLNARYSIGHNPIFDVMIALQNVAESLDIEDKFLYPVIQKTHHTQSKFDLEIRHQEVGKTLSLDIIFNPDVYSEALIKKLTEHFVHLMNAVAENPEKTIGTLSFISVEDESVIDRFSSGISTDYPLDSTVIEQFTYYVDQFPQQIIQINNQSITFQDLDKLSNKLAIELIRLGVRKGEFVPLFLNRSLELEIAIIALLKIGAVYVPIDPAIPAERLSFILEDTNAKISLTSVELEGLFQNTGRPQLVVDRQKILELDLPERSLIEHLPAPDDLAYIIYTSGTTGNPKGVKCHHKGLLNRLLWMKEALKTEHTDTILQKTPYTFDVSVWELLMPMVTGCRLVFANHELHRDPVGIKELLLREKISIVHFVPSMLSAFLQVCNGTLFPDLKHVICSGEALSLANKSQFLNLFGNSIQLHNMYGPTEAAIDVTWTNLTEESDEKISIGKVVPNTTIYIINELFQKQPIGVPGELLIGGVQVATGYLNREELNASQFIPDSFSGKGHLYRTGDIGYWKGDGGIVLLGRNDDQIKVRGFRIEPGEIVSCLLSCEGISEAVVLPRKNQFDENELFAFMQSTIAWNVAEIKKQLSQKIPEYMIPSGFIIVQEWPVTANGKVDKKALLSMIPQERSTVNEYIPPRDELEEKLVNIWEHALGITGIGITDNFFDLGGNSLRITTIVNQIHAEFGIQLRFSKLLQNATIEALAEDIRIVQWNDATDTDIELEEITI